LSAFLGLILRDFYSLERIVPSIHLAKYHNNVLQLILARLDYTRTPCMWQGLLSRNSLILSRQPGYFKGIARAPN